MSWMIITRIRNTVSGMWARIPKGWRTEIVSLTNTFGSTLIAGLAAEYALGHIVWSWTALAAVALAVARSAYKAALAAFVIWIKDKLTPPEGY